MFLFQRISMCCVLIALNGIIKCHTIDTEPSPCTSRFDYDYKVMQKILEMENRIKLLEERGNVSFMAELTANMENPPVDKTVVFGRVHSREGPSYNSKTGIFSAPYNGLYTFSLVASSPPKEAENWLHLFIMKNSEQTGYIFMDKNSDRWLQRATSTVLSLEAGDQVYVKIGKTKGSVTLAGCCFHTVFSGFLIN